MKTIYHSTNQNRDVSISDRVEFNNYHLTNAITAIQRRIDAGLSDSDDAEMMESLVAEQKRRSFTSSGNEAT